MKVIITGHDYSGKSTVLEKLFKENNNGKMSYIHLSYREPTNYEFYKHTLEYSNFVMDRSFLDELIYPEVFGREGNLSFNEAAVLLDQVRNNGIKMYVFECSDEEIKRRILNRTDIEEEPEVLAQVANIKQRYRFFANYFGIPIIDTTNKTYEEIIADMQLDSPLNKPSRLIHTK